MDQACTGFVRKGSVMPRESHVPTVSVVVCAYTTARWELLCRAIRSVRAQTVPPLEILLVVDHCPELLARARDLGADVRVCANVESAGLSGARNTGVVRARADVVAFLDDDAVAEEDWLAHLLRPYDDPRVVGVGGHVVAEWEGGMPEWFPQEFNWVIGCSYTGLPQNLAVVRNPIGANMSFRRDAIVGVGGFATGLGRVGRRPSGCEETELSIRVVRRDPTSLILLEPRAIVRHHVPEDRSRWSYFWRRCWAEGLSKATVSLLADPRSALASERAYTLHTLPRGAARSLGDAIRRGEPRCVSRALAIGAGFGVTAAGYVVGKAGRAAVPEETRQRGLA